MTSPFSFLLLHSAAIRPQEAKDSIDEEDPRPTSSNGATSVASESKNTRFNFYLDVSKLEEGLKVLTPRVDGIDTTVSHIGGQFFI